MGITYLQLRHGDPGGRSIVPMDAECDMLRPVLIPVGEVDGGSYVCNFDTFHISRARPPNVILKTCHQGIASSSPADPRGISAAGDATAAMDRPEEAAAEEPEDEVGGEQQGRHHHAKAE